MRVLAPTITHPSLRPDKPNAHQTPDNPRPYKLIGRHPRHVSKTLRFRDHWPLVDELHADVDELPRSRTHGRNTA